MVGVADPVVVASLADRHQAVLASSLQAGHLGLGEVHRAGLDLTDLEVSGLAGQMFEERLGDRAVRVAGVEPGSQAGVSVDTPGQHGAAQLVGQTGLSHVNLPLAQ